MSLTEALHSFGYTKWVARKSQSRVTFQQHQNRALNKWLTNTVPKVSAFTNFRGGLTDLPIMEKSLLMENFASYNQPKFTTDQVRRTMREQATLGGYLAGASTGTSGNRGLFVISERERFRWLGSILAKTISDLLWSPQRVAIVLPQGGALYESANRLNRLNLQFFDLATGPDAWKGQLEKFNPTVIVAPPKMLRYFVEHDFMLRPTRVFSGAETLDPIDQDIIERGFNSPLRQIYMASEGLLGVTCAHGTLHLAEDSIFFEYEYAGDGLVNPIISSFRRDTQILARYRMNDLLRLSKTRCACGSPLQAVDEVVGRMDDCFHLSGTHGCVMITPDILRNAVLNAHPSIDDFRLIQIDDTSIELHLKSTLDPHVARAAKEAVATLISKRHVRAKIKIIKKNFELQITSKLRRVERRKAP